MKKSRYFAALAGAILAGTGPAWAAVPQQINYQGYLTDAGGTPLTGSYAMVFKLCDAATGGSCPWSETQTVAVASGVFNATLGSVTPIGLDFASQYYLEIAVGGETLSGRQALSAVPYAFRADGVASGSVTSTSIASNTIVNNNLASGSFGNITGLGTLDSLTVSGQTLLANASGKVGIRASSPSAQLQVGGTDGLVVTGTYNSGTALDLGAGMRLQWYPKKGAFRAGYAESSYWNDANMGIYSVAMGYQPRATGTASTAIGAYNRATGDYSLALGSYSQATASHSVAIGTQVFASGIYSIAMGAGADTNNHDGAMVIGDDSYFQTAYASCDNQLTMRFVGNYGGQGNCSSSGCPDTNPGWNAAYRLWSAYPDCTSGVYLMGGSSGWASFSSRELKENFRELDGEELLGKIARMSITEWNYKTNPEIKYIGPVAEEFAEAFHLNSDDPGGINTISIDGVNMAGVQALEHRTGAMRAELDELRALVKALKAEVRALRDVRTTY
jgi:hypothetical protein